MLWVWLITLSKMGKLRYPMEKSRIFLRKQSMQAEKIGQQNWMMHCEIMELLISSLLECPHTEWSMVSNIIYLWNLSIKQCGQ